MGFAVLALFVSNFFKKIVFKKIFMIAFRSIYFHSKLTDVFGKHRNLEGIDICTVFIVSLSMFVR